MDLDVNVFLSQMESDDDAEDTILSVFFPLENSSTPEDSLRLLFLVARDNPHDRSYFRAAFDQFLRKPPIFFKEYFRINQEQFLDLADTLRGDLERHGSVGRYGYPPELKVAASLIILARGESFRGLEPFGVSRSAAQVAFHQFLNSMIKRYGDRIRMPTENNAQQHNEIFQRKAGNRIKFCPKIVGAVDGTHIRIRPPSTNAKPFYNRKNFPSLNVQAVVDGNGRFMHVYVGAPGCVNDARVFTSSDVLELLPDPYMILGDAAYPLRINKVLTPVKDNGYMSELQIWYNEIHSSLRMIVECAFGIWKKKWEILKDLQFLDENVRAHIIFVTCILHNLFLNVGDISEWDEAELEEDTVSDGEAQEQPEGRASEWRAEIINKMFV